MDVRFQGLSGRVATTHLRYKGGQSQGVVVRLGLLAQELFALLLPFFQSGFCLAAQFRLPVLAPAAGAPLFLLVQRPPHPRPPPHSPIHPPFPQPPPTPPPLF